MTGTLSYWKGYSIQQPLPTSSSKPNHLVTRIVLSKSDSYLEPKKSFSTKPSYVWKGLQNCKETIRKGMFFIGLVMMDP